MKDILVHITDLGAVVYKGEAAIASKRGLPKTRINPDLSKVKGVSPSFWDINALGDIVHCTEEEKKKRLERVAQNKEIKGLKKSETQVLQEKLLKIEKEAKLQFRLTVMLAGVCLALIVVLFKLV